MSDHADIEFLVQNEGLFGPALQEFRLRAGVGQAELADRLGLHRSYLSALENGRSNTAMRALMRAFRELDLEIVVRRRTR
jgi:transcriptional regulator with XRE-family HTH domain